MNGAGRLQLDRTARATAKGLTVAPELPFSGWKRLGEQLGLLSNASSWWVGDWLVYGERRYGSGYREAAEIIGLEYQTLRNYAWVASVFPLYRRRDKLSFQHHAEVASLPEEQQEHWLRAAEDNRWSRNELRRRLRAVRTVRDQEERPAAEVVVVRLTVSANQERRWRQAARRCASDLESWITALLDSAAEMDPARPRYERSRRDDGGQRRHSAYRHPEDQRRATA